METIEKFLSQRESAHLLRVLTPVGSRNQGLIYIGKEKFMDFSSNDYLGLGAHPKLKAASIEAINKFGSGASASRLLSGSLDIHHQLEEETAHFKGKQSALVFNSGYQANVGIISALYKRGDVIFCDKLSHASIIDGIVLSGAKFFRFLHNDFNHLESLLKSQRHKFKNSVIITETIFSMNGDKAPLKEIINLKEKHNCRLMVDEAHSTGVFGKTGAGVAEEEGLADRVDLIMGTFSKALGSFGAYLGCAQEIKKYLINTCRSFIYSTALPPAVIAANLVSLDLVKKEPFRRKELLENAKYFREKALKYGLEVKGCSQIAPLIVGSAAKAVSLSKELRNKGYWAPAVRPPTVPEAGARIRFSLTLYHTKEILNKLVEDLKKAVK